MFKRKKHSGESWVVSLCGTVARRARRGSGSFLGNNPCIFHLAIVTLSLTLLAACSGGGKATQLQPQSQPLHAPLITDATAVRDIIGGAKTPETLTSTQIQQAFRSRASSANTLVVSDVYLTAPGIQGEDTSVNCTAGSCGITIDDVTFPISLDTIGTDIGGDRLDLGNVNSEYTPVMLHSGFTLAQHRAAGRGKGGVFEYLSYGGWLASSAFSVDMLTINDGSNKSSLLVGVSYGDASGSRPTMKETDRNRRASWRGQVVGVHKSSGDVIQGHAGITIKDIDTTRIDTIAFFELRNLTSGESVTSMRWQGVPIASDGTFSSTASGDIDGAFYGTEHMEIGGAFNRRGIIGAFGGTRRTAP